MEACMTYDDAEQTRFGGEPGFREETDFRGSTSTGSVPPARGSASGTLDEIFDDSQQGESGRDRMAVHFAWEAILLIGAGVLGFLLFTQHKSAVSGHALRELVVFAAALGMLAFGAAASLRAAAPNLAIGPVAIASAVYFAQHGAAGVSSSGATIVGLAAVAGVAIAVLVVGFHVPGWAGSLAAALGVIVWIQKQSGPVAVAGEFDPTDRAWYYLGGFAAASLVGALLCAIGPVRRGVGRFRATGDPATRRGFFAALVTTAALIISTVLAAIGGILLAGLSSRVQPDLGLDWTALAFGAALVGGVSAFGRRGGVFGTILGTTVVTMVIKLGEAADWMLSPYAVAAVTLASGLIVTRLVETFGRPLLTPDEEPWTSEASSNWSGDAGWSSTEAGSWSSSLPTQTTVTRPDPWQDDRWNTGR
jgi:ribose/xylose/arabinose/galactoside ABC-type transport system permease subunit